MTVKSQKPLLSVQDLSVVFGREDEESRVVEKVSFDIATNERVALVGESGSGKSVTALSILQLHERSKVHYPSGRIDFLGRDLLQLPEAEMRQVRGKDIAMIFQEPMTSLNPVYTIGDQLMEPLLLHEGLNKAAARKKGIELLDRTGIPDPAQRFDSFPHMLSGGQRQRAMIAIALACQPKLLIADEPTTALDVTVQLQILSLLEDLQAEFGMAVLMITHDLNMVRAFADRVCVMQQGRLVEQGDKQRVFTEPRHDYTIHLLKSEPERLAAEDEVDAQASVRMQGENMRCYFPIKKGFFRRTVDYVKAVDDISLQIRPGETIGIVGESGSGKSTLGMCMLRLQSCEGEISFEGERLDPLGQRALRPWRKNFQVVFQDPFSSLSPRMTVEQIIGEGLKIHFPHMDAAERRQRMLAVLDEVGLEESVLWRYPHEFSGGQRQRIAIARVMVLEPKLVLLDEPTSALDVSVQKQVLALLHRLQRKRGISYLFITHDLNVIRAVAHRIMVMRDGKVVESGATEQLFVQPQHDYTRTLLRASLFKSTE